MLLLIAMVLYNSPLAVALIAATLLLVSLGILGSSLRTLAATTSLLESRDAARLLNPRLVRTFRRLVLLRIFGVVFILGFTLALASLGFHRAFEVRADFHGPSAPVEWQRPRSAPLDTRFDRFALPNSASREESLRSH